MRSSININSFRKEIEDKMTASHTSLKSEIEESLANSGGREWKLLDSKNSGVYTSLSSFPSDYKEILIVAYEMVSSQYILRKKLHLFKQELSYSYGNSYLKSVKYYIGKGNSYVYSGTYDYEEGKDDENWYVTFEPYNTRITCSKSHYIYYR